VILGSSRIACHWPRSSAVLAAITAGLLWLVERRLDWRVTQKRRRRVSGGVQQQARSRLLAVPWPRLALTGPHRRAIRPAQVVRA
jgi:hypothetical protein